MKIDIRIMYWKEIPLQVECIQGSKRISLPLNSRFQEGVDSIAMYDGSYGSDAYLDGFQWIESNPIEGNLETVLKVKLEEINEGMPENFISKIRDLIKQNNRNQSPGAIDHWWSKND